MEEKRLHYNPSNVLLPILHANFKSPQKRILIIRPGALGDVIVTLPAFGAIRDYFPDAHIEIMGYTSFLEIVKGRFYADATSRFDQADIAALFLKNAQLPESLRKRFRDIDVIISFVSDKEQLLVQNLKAAGARSVFYYEPFPSGGEQVHISDHFLNFLSFIDIPYSQRTPEIFLRDEDILFGNNFIKDKISSLNKMVVAIHPGSGSRLKCWPVTRFVELILRLQAKMDVCILVISGPADFEITRNLRMILKDRFILVEQLSLPDLAAVIKGCDLFIGNDSGITHLAAAVGTGTIAIFGPTDSGVWGPRGRQVKILYRRLNCSPCAQDKRENCPSQMCLEDITVDDVIREVYDYGLNFTQREKSFFH